jgi:hypothetical protein
LFQSENGGRQNLNEVKRIGKQCEQQFLGFLLVLYVNEDECFAYELAFGRV